VFSSQIPVGFINYKGVRNPEFQEISRIKTKPVESGTVRCRRPGNRTRNPPPPAPAFLAEPGTLLAFSGAGAD
jgi:hypothetical protein